MAFQIADDIRDVTGTDPGKPRYADLQSRTPSLPVLLAVAKDDSLRRRIRDAWAFAAVSPEKTTELGSAVLATGVLDEAVAMMDREIEAAIDALGPFATSVEGAELVSWAHRLSEGIRVQARMTA